MQPKVETAHAKLTWHLHVTGTRDDGYHLIDSEMVSLDLADTLEFADGDGLEVSGPFAEGVPTDAGNLVSRALRLAGKTAQVRLIKRVPAGGGLGGGSSDAAAALRWAGLPDYALAASLGADVAFCVTGGRANVRGVGEQIQPLPFEEREVTLLMPPFGVNTAAVYRAYDQGFGPADEWSDRNHLQAAAVAVEPRLGEWFELLRRYTKTAPVLAGSGSTMFVEGWWPEPPPEMLGVARWIRARTVPPVGET